MSIALYRSHTGWIRETTYGSTSALGARYIPVLSYDPGWEDELERVVDEGIRGAPSKDFAIYTGISKSRGGYTYHFYPDTCGIFLFGIFGGELISTGAQGSTHLFGATDVPPTYTLADFHGAALGESLIRGAIFERVDFAYSKNAGTLTVKPSFVGNASTQVAETTDSYSTAAPFRGWEATVSATASTAMNLRTLDVSLSFARPVYQIWGGSNTQVPNAFTVGPLEVTGSITSYGTTFSELTAYQANSTGSLTIQLDDVASTNTNTFLLTCSNVRFEKVTLDRGGDYSRWTTSFRALHNATDSGPATVALSVASSCGF